MAELKATINLEDNFSSQIMSAINSTDVFKQAVSRAKDEVNTLSNQNFTASLIAKDDEFKQAVSNAKSEGDALNNQNFTATLTAKDDEFRQAVSNAKDEGDTLSNQNFTAALTAKDEVTEKISQIKESMSGFRSGDFSATITAKDEATEQISKTKKSLGEIKKNVLTTIGAKDDASSRINSIRKNAEDLVKKNYRLEISVIDKTKSIIKEITDSIFSLKTLAAGIILGETTKKGFDWTIGNSMENENYLATLQTVLHSEQKGNDALKWSYKDAASTPFDAKQVVSGVTQLATSGLDYEKYLNPLGDAAAAMNKPLEQAIFAMSKLKSGQLGMAVDMFRDFGISNQDWTNAGAKFAKNGEMTGVTPQQAVDMVTKIINDKYGGLMDKKSGTAEGMLSNMGDSISSMGRGLAGIDNEGKTMEGGLFDNFKKQLANIAPLLDQIKGSDAFSKLQADIGQLATVGGEKLTSFLEGFKDPEVVQKYEDTFNNFVSGLKEGAKIALQLGEAFGSVLQTLEPVIDLAVAHPNVFVGLFAGFEAGKGIYTAIGIFKILKEDLPYVSTAIGVFGISTEATLASLGTSIEVFATSALASMKQLFVFMLTTPVGIAITAIIGSCVLLYEAWQHNWGGIREIVASAIDFITDKVSGIISVLQNIGGKALDFIQSQIQQVKDWANSNKDLIDNTWTTLADLATKIIDPIEKVASAIYTSLGEAMDTGLQLVSSILGKGKDIVISILDTISQFWSQHSTQIINVLTNCLDIVQTVIITGIKVVEDILKIGMQVINGDWGGAWETVKTLVKDVFGGVVNVLEDIWNSIVELFGDKYEKIKTTITDLKDKVVGKFEDGIKSLNKTLQDHQTAVKVTATILGTVFGPALLVTGARAAIAGAQIAAHFIINVVKSGLEAAISGGKILLSFVGSMAKAGASAAINGVKILTSFIVNVVKTGIEAVIAGTKLTISFVGALAKAGLSAVINGTKITVSFIAAVIKMGIEAGKTAAIITGKLIFSMAKFALEGYKSIALFASGAMSALKPLFLFMISNPIVLAIAAIIGIVILVYEAWQHNWGGIREKTHAVIDFIKEKIESIKETFSHIKESAAKFAEDIGKKWEEVKKFFEHPIDGTVNIVKNWVNGKTGSDEQPGKNALGTEYWKGGLTWVGENGPELINLNKGAKVINNRESDNMMNSITNNPAMIPTLPSDFSKTGEQIPKSLSKGIKRTSDIAQDSMTQMSQDLLKTFGTGITDNSKYATKSTDDLSTGIQDIFATLGKKSSPLGKNVSDGLKDGIESSSSNVTEMAKTLTDKVIETFKTGFDIHSPSRIMHEIGGHVMQGFINGLSSKDLKSFADNHVKNVIGAFGAAVNVPGGVADWITQALMATGTPLSWLPGLEKLVMAESGGDPNNSNSQAVGGEHATGLLQTLPSTFKEFMQKGMNNILNPVDNAAAAINYIKSRYGDVYNTPLFKGGTYTGYETGTTYATPGYHWVGEKGPELMKFNGGEQVVNNNDSKKAVSLGGHTFYIKVNIDGNVIGNEEYADSIGEHIVDKVVSMLETNV